MALGATALNTSNVKVAAVEQPEAAVPVTVYVLAVLFTSGVPEITPVVVLKLRPCGKAGLIAYDATTAPEVVGTILLIAIVLSKP